MVSLDTSARISVVIVDDELYGRENLKKIITDYCPEVEIKGCANSVINAIELVKVHQPDVVFLDINMPVLDGFDFLAEYENRNFIVVFVTAHEEFGIKALKAGAADYLLKPINIKELKQTVKKLQILVGEKTKIEALYQTKQLLIPASHGFDVLLFDELIRLEAEGCYTKVIVKDGKNKLICRTLKAFEDSLPKEKFFRTHKSHLINLAYIKEFSNFGGTYVTMADGSKVEISRRKAPEFLQRVKSTLNVV